MNTETRRKAKKEQESKEILQALVKLKMILEYQPKISLSGYFKANKLSSILAKALTEGGVVENIGGKGLGVNYVWRSIDPNIKMAEELMRRTKSIRKRYADKQQDKLRKEIEENVSAKQEVIEKEVEAKEEKPTELVIEKINFTTTKYFWGLFEIKTFYNYK